MMNGTDVFQVLKAAEYLEDMMNGTDVFHVYWLTNLIIIGLG